MKYSVSEEFGLGYEQYQDSQTDMIYREVTHISRKHDSQRRQWASELLAHIQEYPQVTQFGDSVWESRLYGGSRLTHWVFPAKLMSQLNELAQFVPDLSKIPPLGRGEKKKFLGGYQVASSFFSSHGKKQNWRGFLPAVSDGYLPPPGKHLVLEVVSQEGYLPHRVLREHLVEFAGAPSLEPLGSDEELQTVGEYSVSLTLFSVLVGFVAYKRESRQRVFSALSRTGQHVALELLVYPDEGGYTTEVVYAYPLK